MKDLRVVFMGTPEFSVPVLKSLIENTNVVLVVSRMDAEVGRKKVLTPSPVKAEALKHNIPVLTPKRLKNEYEEILNYKPDIVITCAYGQIVPKQILDYPEYGCINVHASLLPEYRGANPISKAIYDGQEKTGITIMYMDETLDTGNIIHSEEVKISNDDTLGTLSHKLSKVGASLLMRTLPKILDDTNYNIPQDNESSSYAPPIKRNDERLDFNRPAVCVYNHVRSLNPNPYANTLINGEEWKIIECEVLDENEGEVGSIVKVEKDNFQIKCLDKTIKITKIKPAGKKEMTVKDFFNGFDKNKILGIKVGE